MIGYAPVAIDSRRMSAPQRAGTDAGAAAHNRYDPACDYVYGEAEYVVLELQGSEGCDDESPVPYHDAAGCVEQYRVGE